LSERAASGGEAVRTKAIRDGEPDVTTITCADVTEHADPTAQQYERAYPKLRSIVAELAAANADLRSVHAELRSARHELMVTNDELRFVYDELLTAHARLVSVNEQLRIRQDEQAHTSALVEAAVDSHGERRDRGRVAIVHPTAANQTRS
jgi:hypothetical protein